VTAGAVPRRAVLRGGLIGVGVLTAAAAGVETGVLPGRGLLHSLPPGVPSTTPGRVHSGSFVSARRGGVATGWSVAYPPGVTGAHLPVLVVLHGRGSDHRDAFGASLHLDRFLAADVRAGGAPFAIASVDGGDHSYWHPRRDGDAAGMVVDEFLPLLAARGLATDRIGLLGWSMGGYGALYLAQALGAARVAVAVAESPALWHHSYESAAGAFDDAADFDAHDVFARLGHLRGVALRVDCGDRDGFAPITRDLRAALSPQPAGGIETGSHDASFWRSQAAAQLAFAGDNLARR